MFFLRVGWSNVPVVIRVLASDLIADCTDVNAARFRFYRMTSDAETIVSASISDATADGYTASYTPTEEDTAHADVLRVYVDSSTDGGATWFSTSEPVRVMIEKS